MEHVRSLLFPLCDHLENKLTENTTSLHFPVAPPCFFKKKNTHKSKVTVKLEGVVVATGSTYSVRGHRRVRAARAGGTGGGPLLPFA